MIMQNVEVKSTIILNDIFVSISYLHDMNGILQRLDADKRWPHKTCIHVISLSLFFVLNFAVQLICW